MKERACDIVVCDAMVRRFLPAMRAEMVFRLVNQQGLSQSDAAKRLGITRAAVSQYLSGKRGDAAFKISPGMDALIDRWVMAVAGSEDCITLCDICRCAMNDPACQEIEAFSEGPGLAHGPSDIASSCTTRKGGEQR